MKNLLLILTLTLITTNLFAQYNQFKDGEAYRDKQRQQMAKHHIKQVDEYMLSGNDTTLTGKHPNATFFMMIRVA